MATALVTSSSYTSTAAATSHTCTFTVSSGTTGLLIYATYGDTNEDPTVTVTADGTTLTAITTSQGAGARGDGSIYYVAAPAIKSGYNVVVTLSLSRRCVIHVQHLSGVHQTTAPTSTTGTFTTGTGVGDVTITGGASGAFGGIWINRTLATGWTAGANTTETFDSAVSNNSADRTFCGYGVFSGSSLALSATDANGGSGGSGTVRGILWLEAPAGGSSNAPRSAFYHLQGMR